MDHYVNSAVMKNKHHDAICCFSPFKLFLNVRREDGDNNSFCSFMSHKVEIFAIISGRCTEEHFPLSLSL